MLGIGGHLEKNTKIKILGTRAKEYNAKFEELEKQGHTPEEISQMLATQDFQKRHDGSHYEPEPYKVSSGMQGLGGSLGMCFEDAHKTKSETQTMLAKAEQNLRNTRDLKSKGLPVVDVKKLQEQRQADLKIKNRICQDHLWQTVQGVQYSQKKQSDYGANFVHNEQFQKEVEEIDMSNHQRKNDLKWYSEEYVKTKLSLRK